MKKESSDNNKKTKPVVRVLAMVGVILLAGLYVVTIISAVTATPNHNALFMISLVATIIVPVIIYVIKWLMDVFS